MIDFSSSLYLGMRHGSSSLPGWSSLTTGRPAVLDDMPRARVVAARLARLATAERAMLTRSTLHGLGDCLDVLAGPDATLVVDGGLYPVGRWAVRQAVGRGVHMLPVAHQDAAGTARAISRVHRAGRRAVVVADGLCGGCGRRYPLAAIVDALRVNGGMLLVDDTQALGLLGSDAGEQAPYGLGGGGSVRHARVAHDLVVGVSSLAKAFGAPVACVAGPAAIVDRVRITGSAVYASPPSAADIAAAAHALQCNAAIGDMLRARLAARVIELRRRAAEDGLRLTGGLFPVQSTPAIAVSHGRRLLDRLAAGGVRAVLRRECNDAGSAVALVVRVEHRLGEIELAARLLGSAWRQLDGQVPDAC